MADDTSPVWGLPLPSNLTKIMLLALAVFISLCNNPALSSAVVEMKVVDEPSSYGFGNNNLHQWGGAAESDDRLKMRVQPANVSGPPHLSHLRKRCFSKTFENYKYNFCPFANVSQHEQSYHWNPYNGLLGVWQEWEIENNTFVSMEMQEGDDCGQIHRSVKVKLECGNSSEIMSVSEPSTCHYVMVFQTPLVCHPQSLLVYPTLSAPLRAKWDQLEGQRQRRELTEKGYRKRLHQILQEAGLRLTAQRREALSAAVTVREEKEKQEQRFLFNSIPQCVQSYNQLQAEVEELREKLASYKNASGQGSALNASHMAMPT